MSDITINNPFENIPGEKINWVVRDRESGQVISAEMDHYDAIRARIDNRIDVLSRADRVKEDVVVGHGFDNRHLTTPTSIDIAPALEKLSMQDFVHMQGEGFDAGEVTNRLVRILADQGDPRAQRLTQYEDDWSTPDENGERAKACIRVDPEDVMAWCEKHRPEIHDELSMRKQPSLSYTD